MTATQAILRQITLRFGTCLARRFVGMLLAWYLLAAVSAGASGPAMDPHLVLWLDAQDIDGDGKQGSGPIHGAPVTRWGDKSEHGNHARQDSLAHQPTYVVDGVQRGRNAIRFDAARRQYLSAGHAASLSGTQLTAFVVARALEGPANMWLFGKNHWGPPWTGYGIAVSRAGLQPWPHLGLRLDATGASQGIYFQYGSGVGKAWALIELCYDGKRLTALRDGKVERAHTARGSILANDRDLLIGAGPQLAPACEFLQGEISELLLYDQALAGDRRGQIRRYLAEKYGLTVADEREAAAAEQVVLNQVIDNGYLPVTVENPQTPTTRTLRTEEATVAVERDWLFQAMDEPLAVRAGKEIAWARELAARLASPPRCPDIRDALAALATLEKRLPASPASSCDAATARQLYLAVRQIKRRLLFQNPAVDFSQLLFIDQPYPQGPEWKHEAVHRLGHRAVPGGRLLVLDGLDPGGRLRSLTPDKPGSFWRPELSFDGRTVLFCYKAHDDRSFHLYETSLDGSGLRQLTNSPYDDIDPVYLPDGHIIFTTTRGNSYVRCGPYIYSYVLARCDRDGGQVYLISTNSEPDFVPALLNDGRVVYSRWEYSDKDQNRVQSLWTTNQDGTGTAVLWGNQSIWPDHLAEPRPLPGTGRVMFTGVGHHNWFIGSIGIIDPKKGSNYPHGLTRVTWDLPWAEVGNSPGDVSESPQYHASGRYSGYLGAYPISAEDFLVSAKGLDDKFRVYLMDVRGNRELIYEGFYNAWYAIPVRPRPVPPSQADRVDWPGTGENRTAKKPGVFYNADVYQGVPELPPGSVKYLRVFQQDAKTYSTWHKIFGYSGPVISAVQTEAVKRIVSVVPVESDGSAYFEVPAGESLFFQLLDGQSRALHTMRSFSGVMPGERRACVGCHEMHSTAPPGRLALAQQRPPTRLNPPPWGTESIGYERFVQPVLEQYCGECHLGNGQARKDFDLTVRPATGSFQGHFTEPYLTLIGPAAWPVSIPNTGQPGYGLAGAFPVYGLTSGETYANDPATDAKTAIWRTMRPMQYLSLRSRLIEMAGSGKHYDVKADPLSLCRLIAWVDANCPYIGEEELRTMADPEFAGIDQLPIRPQVKTAPVIERP
ncbi:MAG: hypothetical protein NTY19_41620 [Planctomycetota bacterium]|nr:hypothetical protein [Planctomycetota bacterium]